ncbi:MAG: hypothetical protein L3K14_09925 [Thermoplasmata archaeon]|nr:hypothetical protein [Thermoplasmata archaeon]
MVAFSVLVGVLLVGILPLGEGASAPGGVVSQALPTPSNPSWSNGLLKIDFLGPGPVFTVQSLADSRVSMGQTLSGLAEVNSTGIVVALASFASPSVAWSFQSRPTANGIAVAMASNLSVARAHGDWEEGDDANENGTGNVGMTHATIQFYINSSSSISARTVAYTLSVTGWPWSHRADYIGLQVNSSASQNGALWKPTSLTSIAEVSGSTTIATFQWGTGARVSYSDGTSGLSVIEADQNQSRWTSQSFVRLDFGSVTGGYSSLEYDPWITLNPSAFKALAWVFTPATLETSAGALAVVAILAAVATVRKRRPARLDL